MDGSQFFGFFSGLLIQIINKQRFVTLVKFKNHVVTFRIINNKVITGCFWCVVF